MSDKLVKHLNFGQDAKDQIFKGISVLSWKMIKENQSLQKMV